KVVKVPCYAFHDGFSMYKSLLNGVLPVVLLPIKNTSVEVRTRFINATVGWIRYKPLLVYITDRENFELTMDSMHKNLTYSIPKLCEYFKTEEFCKILIEFEKYRKNVKKHFNDFEKTKITWTRLLKNAL